MLQTSALVDTLKQQLKASGKTYADIATDLDLSEASVKRLFSERNFTLQRLEIICDAIGISFFQLVEKMSHQQQSLTQLTLEQEREVANDVILLLIAVSVINGFCFEDLVSQYKINETECIQKLAQLDRLKLIELLPGNRIRLLVSPNFNWLANGPIQKFFQEKVEQDFFSSRFDKQNEKLLVLNAVLSPNANAELQRKMQTLAHDFNTIMKRDAQLPLSERKGTTMVLALRQWQYSLFKNLRK
ncbi:helix-turn-helix transcriptional regulator [Pontibacterium granulatum]|uniref:helix-turn-helix domain-containing protein n=1 Tax=Pontibacterium granulatum TaxID=2036029 RepID=UPI00249BC818|nr:helix-turn-helix transcriptional regulator [Pontibacterium granulatum]MDI3325041.1 helix-turn-helix transcriptional regulator [Pontibacterium granulatum]